MTEVTIPPVDTAVPVEPVESEVPAIQNYTDGYSYEVPRPFLTLPQAAQILGMTLRSIERSVRGRWGSKLPDGWLARKMKTSTGDEWRILPPPGFRVKLNASVTECDTITVTEYVEPQYSAAQSTPATDAQTQGYPASYGNPQMYGNSPATGNANGGNTNAGNGNGGNGNGDPMSYYNARRKQPWRPERHTLDQPTIIIDRTEEVENLLRELVATKTQLAEERRLQIENLRLIGQLQSSMRLLETAASEQAKAKSELEVARQELNVWKEKYNQIINMPWWRRMFGKQP